MSDQAPNDFEKAAREKSSEGGILSEFWGFLRENKKWWLLPIVILLLLFGLLIMLSGTGLAPFIYTLF
jgi:drug/metabolite transporter superfamily protein YnfA